MNAIRRAYGLGTKAIASFALGGCIVGIVGVAPARAAAPVVGAFLPLSGAPGTSVTIAGSGFNDASPATGVAFNGTPTSSFTINSDLQITATVPSGATTGTISVTDSEGTGTTLVNFTVTSSPVPIIAAFLPTTGPVGTSVTITGTGFTGATAVAFNGTPSTFTVNSGTQIHATVPFGATTGPITVTTPGGSATSLVNFTVTEGPVPHDRSVTLKLIGDVVARGRLSSGDGLSACVSKVLVRIQKKVHGQWHTIATARTNASGKYRKALRDRPGVYRAAVLKKKVNGGADVCGRDNSPARRNV